MNPLIRNLKLLQKMLFDAAKDGDINLMKECLKVGADPYIPDEHGHDAIFHLKRTAPEKSDKFHFWITLVLLHKLINKMLNEKDGI